MNISSLIREIEDIISKRCTQEHFVTYPEVYIIINEDMENTYGYEEIDSWRGSYDTPCIFTGNEHSSLGLLKELYFAQSENYFTGYKGGLFSYRPHTEIVIDHGYGTYSGDGEIDRVEWNSADRAIEIYYTLEK